MPQITEKYPGRAFARYLSQEAVKNPLLLLGDALAVLSKLPNESIDMVMTSPPYWGKRQYIDGGLGLEKRLQDYLDNLGKVFAEIQRILKPTGSFWLNIGDSYYEKGLAGVPWRLALAMTDQQGWILRNDVIWNKLKGGMDNTKDRLGNVHEHLFHFVKCSKGYYYDSDAIRNRPREAKVVNGAIISATGVSGVRYKRQIELSTALTQDERTSAFNELEKMLADISAGKISDFRMVIRGHHRSTHSDDHNISGRGRELRDKGFYFLKYHPKGSKLSDVWDILPVTKHGITDHFAPFPLDLCKVPIQATCPANGIILDPFCGTGTTLLAASLYGRKSVGIDISRRYLEMTQDRCNEALV